MAYSCGYYESPDATLEEAQEAKFRRHRREARALSRAPRARDRHGLGRFRVWAARRYGCRVTTTTISRAQHDARAGPHRGARDWRTASRSSIEDYRRLSGTFDRIVSIEMFEAVGLERYDEFFGAAERLLSPDGAMLRPDDHDERAGLPAYRRRPDWIQLHVFPGAELACLSEILRSIGRVTAADPLSTSRTSARTTSGRC